MSDSEGALLTGECKWSAHPVGTNVLIELERKTLEITASGRWQQVHIALFSKSGFTQDLRTVAADRGVLLISADQMV